MRLGSALGYYLFLKPISMLPHWALYLLSDIVCFVLQRILKYRIKIIRGNLNGVYPDKTHQEIKQIENGFYSHFCDLVVEGIKNFSISQKQAMKRMVAVNPEVFEKYQKEGRQVLFCGAHYNNWELWALAMPSYTDFNVTGIYKKLNNPFFEKKVVESRTKYGLNLIETKELTDEYFEAPGMKASVFAFDQSPQKSKRAYWINFLGRPTACFFGPEKFSVKYDIPVMYGTMTKVKRGYYEVKFETLIESPRETEYGQVTRILNRELEKQIYDEPKYWLWSHRRWKHGDPPEELEGNIT
jgi:KDO2-lipid IV(A) lauroyltransferase